MDTTDPIGRAVFPSFRFAGEWRDYQARVLEELQGHLDDARLNIVAAPGAGKTVLGIEVLRRLDSPALVLSPTRAIRDQWIQRLHELFVPESGVWPEGIGTAIATPGWFTSSTYQSLHAALRGLLDTEEEDGESDEDDDADDEDDLDAESGKSPAQLAGESLLKVLTDTGIETLVLDEAHHLRRAWWESLQEVIAHLRRNKPNFHIVSLTATPPYDVEQDEWDRYEEVCGPIDAEISIPELVKQGDLCPHQDFLHFSVARGEAIQSMETFAAEAESLAQNWAADQPFLEWISAHPWAIEPVKNEAQILAKPAVFCGMLAVMKANGRRLPDEGPDILGLTEGQVPPVRINVLEALFREILTDDDLIADEELAARLRRELQSIGALWRGRLRLRKKHHLVRALAGTSGKLDSIEAIARAESEALREGLRLVVLTDFIRSSALSRPADKSSDSLGAGPVLRRLGQAGLAPALRPAMMTGTWVVVPDEVIPALRAEAAKQGLEEDELTLRPMPHIPGWSRVLASSGKASLRLRIITHLFEEGHLRCLVGTAALLGEGWDAPSINSLILATSVKSFMLSNQMRGRAIRISKRDPQKVSAIWHLTTILDPNSNLGQSESTIWDFISFSGREAAAVGRLDLNPYFLGYDALSVFRRFKTFAGVSHFEPPVIESGIGRLGIDTIEWFEGTAAAWNKTMLARAADRPQVAQAWSQVFFDKAQVRRPSAGAQLPQPAGHDGITRFGTTWLLGGLIGSILLVALNSLQFLNRGIKFSMTLLGLGIIGAAVYHSGAILRTFRAGSPMKYMTEIGRSILDALGQADVLDNPRRALDVRVEDALELGSRYCRLVGGNHHDEVAFAEAMVTFFAPIDNPKRLLIRHHRVGWLKQVDYHAIPDAIADNEAALKQLQAAWQRRIGRCEVVNTRTREGRLFLLRARTLAYSTGFRKRAERKLRWE